MKAPVFVDLRNFNNPPPSPAPAKKEAPAPPPAPAQNFGEASQDDIDRLLEELG